ncbi:PC-esterase domain-containing protein 1A [Corythoichthys intestinalis]|uniref:PC-esterase domain-containing protein 1A n=1 Tax=Corythoichthys intestinalis TaxID=161448 RepID=UPI0025A5FD6A|nr:PC-esterase domain-containing protein 1A [Corythoichthys intestinalis]
MEEIKCVSHQHASQLFHNKFIVVLGDSIQRSVYKDLVLLLQYDRYLRTGQLKSKGEMSFELDLLVEGGCLSPMHNGINYREVRQYQSDHHMVRFYFVTRIYSDYMKSVLQDFRLGLKPDLVIVNSCVWDISRYNLEWLSTYRENLNTFFEELHEILPEESLVIWNLTMPLGEKIKGGFLAPEISYKASHLRHDVIEANFYSGTLAAAYNLDVLDLHFHFRFSLQHRASDGIHWNALAHRRISTLLSLHAADAWGVELPLTARENLAVAHQLPVPERDPSRVAEKPKRITWSPRHDVLNFEANAQPPSWHWDAASQAPYFNPYPHPNGMNFSPHPPYRGFMVNFDAKAPPYRHKDAVFHTNVRKNDLLPNGCTSLYPHVVRTRYTRHKYMPYTHHRPYQHY